MVEQLPPGAKRAYLQMQANIWYTPAQLRTNRQTMNRLLKAKLVRGKATPGNYCHAPENGKVYQKT